MKNYFSAKKIAQIAIFTALIFISTILLKVPNGYGYVNLGDTFIFLSAFFYGPFFAFICGGTASCLADFAGGYVIYALSTFIIKSIEGFLCGFICKLFSNKLNIYAKIIFALFLSGFFMVISYLITNIIIFNLEIALICALSDSIQLFINLILTFILSIVLSKNKYIRNLNNSSIFKEIYEKSNDIK